MEVGQRGLEQEQRRHRDRLQLGLEHGQEQPAERKEQQQRDRPGRQRADHQGRGNMGMT